MATLTEPDDNPPSMLQRVKVPLWAFLAVVLLLIAMTVARQMAASEADRQVAAERQEQAAKLDAEKRAIEAAAGEKLARHSEHAHLLFGDALAWAIRSALVRNDVSEVDQYFAELVKNKRVTLAVLANASGRIVASSDRRFFGKSFGDHFAPELLKTDRISLHAGDGDQRQVVLPIRGLTSRLGTALVAYTAP